MCSLCCVCESMILSPCLYDELGMVMAVARMFRTSIVMMMPMPAMCMMIMMPVMMSMLSTVVVNCIIIMMRIITFMNIVITLTSWSMNHHVDYV